MIQAQALVDYEKFCCAKVALFVDIAKVSQSHALVDKHREAITRIANLFSARVLLVDQSRLQP
ncbi:MAG: hypothetical protein C0617_10120 [Desulfuromonas sp.]|nr:hypothetical protein [Desulfuromonas sp.]PLX83872.1 MAG: hypothetical protein C0617_10120 [Desulfuromonas sp.]